MGSVNHSDHTNHVLIFMMELLLLFPQLQYQEGQCHQQTCEQSNFEGMIKIANFFLKKSIWKSVRFIMRETFLIEGTLPLAFQDAFSGCESRIHFQKPE